MRKRTLVAGSTGLLGSHLCERLVEAGDHVTCVDDFYTSVRDNVFHLLGSEQFELIRHDVTFPLYVEVDEIFNLACPASPIHYQRDPAQTTKTNVMVRSIFWAWQSERDRRFFGPRHPRFTAILRCIRSRKAIGATLIRLARARAMTRVNDVRRHCFSTIVHSMDWASKWLASLTPMASNASERWEGGVVLHCTSITW